MFVLNHQKNQFKTLFQMRKTKVYRFKPELNIYKYTFEYSDRLSSALNFIRLFVSILS